MSKKKFENRRNNRRSVKLCDPGVCDCCQYLGEGDFLCDKHMEIVVADWKPTENFMTCDESWGEI